MSKQYFDLHDDVYVPGRWMLDDLRDAHGQTLDGNKFVKGVPLDFDGALRLPLYRHGIPLDFSELVGTRVPIVSRRVADLLLEMASNDIQSIPVRVETQAEEYFLINVRRTVKCIDDNRSAEVQYWTPQDGRPAKVGKYRAVMGMRVDPDQIPPDINIFRPWGWTWTLVVSDAVRTSLLRLGATGMKFTAV